MQRAALISCDKSATAGWVISGPSVTTFPTCLEGQLCVFESGPTLTKTSSSSLLQPTPPRSQPLPLNPKRSVEEVRPGDVVWFPPGVKHWHGASPTTAMTHTAIQEALDGKVVDWMELVSDEQYRK